MARRTQTPTPLEERVFSSVQEIDAATAKLKRRITEVETLDVQAAVMQENGADEVVRSNVRAAIREVFGQNSPEYHEHQYLDIWAGGMYMNMPDGAIIQAKERGKTQVVAILNGLIARLGEKREDLSGGIPSTPRDYFDSLNLYSRIAEVSRDLFHDGYPWEAVFAAAKALVNYVKERSSRHDLDGAPLMRTVFSRNNPILAFNDLSDTTDQDEQEGMMHLFEGAVLGIRNPGGHSFPEGSEQRAIEYLSLISLLAYRIQESKRRSPT